MTETTYFLGGLSRQPDHIFVHNGALCGAMRWEDTEVRARGFFTAASLVGQTALCLDCLEQLRASAAEAGGTPTPATRRASSEAEALVDLLAVAAEEYGTAIADSESNEERIAKKERVLGTVKQRLLDEIAILCAPLFSERQGYRRPLFTVRDWRVFFLRRVGYPYTGSAVTTAPAGRGPSSEDTR